jgi:hypothetical protein
MCCSTVIHGPCAETEDEAVIKVDYSCFIRLSRLKQQALLASSQSYSLKMYVTLHAQSFLINQL